MKKPDNAFQIVQETEDLILRHSNVYVTITGWEMIALLDCAASIAETMEGTNVNNFYGMKKLISQRPLNRYFIVH